MPLDEKALRKEGFSEGSAVRLGDGQLWTFPKPHLSMFSQVADGKIEAGYIFTHGKDYADRLDQYIECEDTFEKMCIQLELASGLLLRNYDLDNKALRRLISIDTDGADVDPEMWPAIQAVLFGRDAPKPSAVGSDSASQPTA
jgi:hypothetical protein